MVIDMEKTKKRSEMEKKYLTRRLKIIEGQVRGLISMVDNDRYCGDLLIQISAVDQSLKSLGLRILKNHLETCVVNDIKNDNLEIIDEVMDLISKLD